MNPEDTTMDGGNTGEPVFDYAPLPPARLRYVPGVGYVPHVTPNPTREDKAYQNRLARRRKAKKVARATRKQQRRSSR